MIILALILFGLAFGSFVNALVWRLYKQHKTKSKVGKYSITKGRSMCVNCKHMLGAADLVPVFSWLALRGKCRYCHKPISAQYPLVELLTAGLFVASYIFWPNPITGLEIAVFITWLAILVGLIALFVYDIKWMILPNRIVFALYGLGALFAGLRLIQNHTAQDFMQLLLAIIIGGGVFWLIYQISSGKWIGGGDVKLGFVLGALCGTLEKSFLMLFLASLLGLIYILPGMLASKVSKSSRIPFGPFLILATIIVVLFGGQIINWYYDTILIVPN